MAQTNAIGPVPSDTIGPGGIKRGTSGFIRLAKKARPWLNSLLVPYSKVGNAPLTDPALFPWIGDVLADAASIRAEADRIMQHRDAVPPFRDFAPGHERIVSRDDWRSFFFWGYGYPLPENLARCPETARALARIPGLVSAMYSVVAPGARIRLHRGVNKAIMTLHVGLRVPADTEKCRMEVDGLPAIWREGKALVLDDTFPHEVWNDTPETRVILLVQFRRPMRQPGRMLAALIVWLVRRSSFVQRARCNLQYWEKAFAAAERG